MESGWQGRQVLVTGGAAFIGSHLVDALVARGARVRVVDNLSSGVLENIATHIDAGKIEFVNGDLLKPDVARDAVNGCSVVFHLAADHGGRGYVDLHQVECSTNLILDGQLFKACYEAGANSYMSKRINLVEFMTAIERMSGFWMEIALLPRPRDGG